MLSESHQFFWANVISPFGFTPGSGFSKPWLFPHLQDSDDSIHLGAPQAKEAGPPAAVQGENSRTPLGFLSHPFGIFIVYACFMMYMTY